MPTYEYSCENGHAFEEFQSMVAEPLHTCPICGGKAQRKISGGSGLIFKGTGFYITDYARKNSSGSSSGSSTSKHAETKTESAPAAETKSASTSAPAEKKGD